MVLDSSCSDEKEIVLITEDQMNNFAGNMLELQGADGRRYFNYEFISLQCFNQKANCTT